MTRDSSTVQRCGRYLFSAVFAISCLAVVQACSSDAAEDSPSESSVDQATPEALVQEAAEDSADLAELGTLEQAVTSCSSSAQCSDNNACTSERCQAGQCIVSNVAAGTSCGNGRVCSGTGVCIAAPPSGCTSNAQCASGNACTTARCQAGQCILSNVAAGTSCGSGRVCSGTGVCIAAPPPGCTSSLQCPAGGVCTTNACISGQCVNRLAPAGTLCNTVGFCSATGTCIIIQ